MDLTIPQFIAMTKVAINKSPLLCFIAVTTAAGHEEKIVSPPNCTTDFSTCEMSVVQTIQNKIIVISPDCCKVLLHDTTRFCL